MFGFCVFSEAASSPNRWTPLLLSQQVFFENSLPLRVNTIHRLSYEIFCSVVYRIQFYLHTDEFVLTFGGVLACGVSRVLCVWGCMCCENVL